MVTVPAGTRTAVPKVNGPGSPPPVAAVSVTVYDWTITLSSALGVVIVGFLRLFRRVTQAKVVVPVSMDELTVAGEKPSTDRKVNALPL